ncbi:MAG: helix-turn-helix transcriptional regulator, partial [Thermoleophilia bacterium]|nr:helix-turn-helix transcriptional regulator [Thermoleophilia bacterium]
MKRTSLQDQPCAIAKSLDIIGDWWTLLIIRDALVGLRRFGEFQRSLGAAKNILAARLKALVAEGILVNAPASDGSAYQEYLLTEKGRALVPVLVALSQWSSEHAVAADAHVLVPLDSATSQPLAKLELRTPAGRVLSNSEVTFPPGLV